MRIIEAGWSKIALCSLFYFFVGWNNRILSSIDMKHNNSFVSNSVLFRKLSVASFIIHNSMERYYETQKQHECFKDFYWSTNAEYGLCFQYLRVLPRTFMWIVDGSQGKCHGVNPCAKCLRKICVRFRHSDTGNLITIRIASEECTSCSVRLSWHWLKNWIERVDLCCAYHLTPVLTLHALPHYHISRTYQKGVSVFH